jgi:hypothetical protein
MPNSINGYRIVGEDHVTYLENRRNDFRIAMNPQVVVRIRDLLPIDGRRVENIAINVWTIS